MLREEIRYVRSFFAFWGVGVFGGVGGELRCVFLGWGCHREREGLKLKRTCHTRSHQNICQKVLLPTAASKAGIYITKSMRVSLGEVFFSSGYFFVSAFCGSLFEKGKIFTRRVL